MAQKNGGATLGDLAFIDADQMGEAEPLVLGLALRLFRLNQGNEFQHAPFLTLVRNHLCPNQLMLTKQRRTLG